MRRRRGREPEPAPAPPPPQAPPPAARLGPAAFGPLLIGLGALFLVDRLSAALGVRSVLWTLVFGAAAALLFVLYSRDRRYWWAVFPGFGLVAIAAAVMAGNVGGGLLFGLAGTACVLLYLRGTGRRWLLLLGGALVSLGVLAILEGAFANLDHGWVLFAGLSATLFVLNRGSPETRGWSLYLAVAMAALALIALFTGRFVETLIAIVLIASGTAMVWRDRTSEALHEPAAPLPEPVTAPDPVPPPTFEAAREDADARVSRPLWERLRRGRR